MKLNEPGGLKERQRHRERNKRKTNRESVSQTNKQTDRQTQTETTEAETDIKETARDYNFHTHKNNKRLSLSRFRQNETKLNI